jgi:hypothetical protein
VESASAAGDSYNLRIVPILLNIGLLIGAQAFQAVPRLHAVAVVAAILPNLAQWASGLIDNALNAAGTSATGVGMDKLKGAGVVYEGLQTRGEGAVLVGLIHAPQVEWTANPQVALGYLFFALACVGYSLLPGAKDPVEVDEADIVAGQSGTEASPARTPHRSPGPIRRTSDATGRCPAVATGAPSRRCPQQAGHRRGAE